MYFEEKYLSNEALQHIDGTNQYIMSHFDMEEDRNPKFTNEEVRNYAKTDLFDIALNLRLRITEHDKLKKSQLFKIAWVVITCILIMTYLNALIQNIFYNTLSWQTTLTMLRFFTTILGCKYTKQASTCLADELLYFVVIFVFLAYDVYVIQVITKLEIQINRQLNTIKKSAPEYATMKIDALEAEEGVPALGNDILNQMANQSKKKKQKKPKGDDDDVDSDNADEFEDVDELDLGIEEQEEEYKLLKDLQEAHLIEGGNPRDIELGLLDEKDQQEIKIRALKSGENATNLKVYNNYEALERLGLFKWNFYEFYLIVSDEQEEKFKSFMIETRRARTGNESSSESDDPNESSDSGDMSDAKLKKGNEESVKIF
jgi:hypothetical protein